MRSFGYLCIGMTMTVPPQMCFAANQPVAKSVETPVLCRGHYHSEAEAMLQLKRMAATYSNLEEWKQRASRVRKQILVSAKLDPQPERTPLNSIIHRKRVYDGYSVESAAFEARPGFFVYGNLYRPTAKKGPRPGILSAVLAGRFAIGLSDVAPSSRSTFRYLQFWYCLYG